jgi:hypothetical protein
MSQYQAAASKNKTNMAFLFASKPTAPVVTNHLPKERKTSDPSASLPGGRSYPIPDFFSYRSRPKEYDIH